MGEQSRCTLPVEVEKCVGHRLHRLHHGGEDACHETPGALGGPGGGAPTIGRNHGRTGDGGRPFEAAGDLSEFEYFGSRGRCQVPLGLSRGVHQLPPDRRFDGGSRVGTTLARTSASWPISASRVSGGKRGALQETPCASDGQTDPRHPAGGGGSGQAGRVLPKNVSPGRCTGNGPSPSGSPTMSSAPRPSEGGGGNGWRTRRPRSQRSCRDGANGDGHPGHRRGQLQSL